MKPSLAKRLTLFVVIAFAVLALGLYAIVFLQNTRFTDDNKVMVTSYPGQCQGKKIRKVTRPWRVIWEGEVCHGGTFSKFDHQDGIIKFVYGHPPFMYCHKIDAETGEVYFPVPNSEIPNVNVGYGAVCEF